MLGTAQVITFVATTDAEKARVFYEARLGLALVGDEASALVFDMHGVMLRVLKVEAVTPAEHAVLGWKVMDIEATIEGLGSKGVVFERRRVRTVSMLCPGLGRRVGVAERGEGGLVQRSRWERPLADATPRNHRDHGRRQRMKLSHRGTFARYLLTAGCLLVASSAAAQRGPVPDPLVREGETVKLSEHAYVIPDFNVGLVPNVGIVVGSRATLVIDPGLGRRNGETVLREVAKITDNPEVYIASTHFHAEHTTGYLGFPDTAQYVNSTVQEAEFAEGSAAQFERFSSRSPMTAELLAGATGRSADITFDREHTLDLGGVIVRFLVVGPTHTRGDTGIFVEGDGVLFSGDVVMNNSFLAAGQVTSMTAWLAAFDAFDAMGPTTIVPAHGAVGEGAIIATNREIMLGVQTRVRELKAAGRSAEDAATAIQMEFQGQHPDWPRANGLLAAARAAYAEAP